MTVPRPGFLEQFRTVVEVHADRPALVTGGTQVISYAELYGRAAALGERLKELGAGPERIVGLHLEKSSEYVTALLATWFAGAAFLPLDPALPPERLAFIAGDSGMTLAVMSPGHGAALDGLGIRLAAIGDEAERPSRVLSPPPRSGEEDLAYVIYTSGSTGTPKGVMVPHRGIVNFLHAQIPVFRIGPDSRALFYLSTSFDASISDIGTALLSGAALCIEPAEALQPGPALVERIGARGITHLDIPPALLRVLEPARMPACVETIIIGGEACPPEVVRRWAERFRVVNVYGPTEATVCTSLCVCDPVTWRRPLLGRPIPNATLHLLDERLAPVAPGTAAELYIGGIGLARGYLNRPDLTAARFLVRDGERLYRTGDRVVERDGGEIDFLGRVDRQVKVRGLLIEPEEIEARLLQHPEVRHAAVVKRPLPRAAREGLVAFVVPRTAGQPVPAGELRVHLARSLPRWMLPQRFEFVDRLPLTSTGKVDLQALATRALSRRASGWTPGLANDETGILAEIWEWVLGVEGIGPTDDFFEIGGDSLAVLEVVAAAESCGLRLSPPLLLRHPTLADLAARLHAGAEGSADVTSGAMSCAGLREDVAFGAEWHELLRSARQRPHVPVDGPPRALLLTGATGFLGSRLLHELLLRTGAEVHCLVRAQDDAAATRRLQAALHGHGKALDPEQARRVLPVRGDIDLPLFGLDQGEWACLAGSIDTIYHCAARVHLVAAYDALRASNVLGTREVLRLLCTGRRKRLHYASTLSVFVATDRNTGLLAEADDLASTGWVYGGYAQSKWAAEYLLRSAGGEVGQVRFYRLGLITGDATTGYCSPTDFLSLFCKGLAALGCVPRRAEELRLDVTPVDFAAAAMAHLSLHAAGAGAPSTFHIANSRSLSLGELLDALRAHGIAVAAVSDAEWRGRLAEFGDSARGAPEAAAYLALCRALPGGSAFARQRTLDLFQATGVEFGMKNTLGGLAGSGIACPPPSGTLLRTYLTYLRG